MRLTFIGAAQEVTGSCFLVEADGVRFLVDCGMFQGGREARERNLRAWPSDPRQIDFVLLTHADIDDSGLLARLCALGFTGQSSPPAPPSTCWWSSPPTAIGCTGP